MTTALFPLDKDTRLSTTATIKAGFCPDLLADIAAAGTDAKDALELFSYLCNDDDGSSSTPGFMAFDAHVGDTSCHVRAIMFWTLRAYIKQKEPCSFIWHVVKLLIQKLSALIERTKQLCRNLTVDRVGLTAVGISTMGESRRSILEKLGWYEPIDQMSSPPSNGLLEKSTLLVAMTLVNRKESSECGDLGTWNPSNIRQVVRFIVYSYRLSKYKSFCRLSNNVGARLDPAVSLETAERVMEGSWNQNCPGYTPWRNKKRTLHDFNTMQNWLGELSCSWMLEMAKRELTLGPDMVMLLAQLVQTSSTGLSAIPSYLGWLVIRSVLAETSTPILLIDKRFCNHGFHINYFLVKLGAMRPASKLAGADRRLVWHLTQVSAVDLLAHSDTTPHYCISGNSLDGTISDFMQITSSPVPRHKDSDCVENIQHCLDFLAADHDAIALASLADHRHYAFPLINQNRDELEVVAEAMDKVVPGLSELWRKQKNEAFSLGTSISMEVFNWQHVVLETVGRAAAQFENSDGLSPISAPIK